MVFRFSRAALGALIFALLASSVSIVQAATVVVVQLWDQGAATQMATDLAYPVSEAQHTKATMGIKISTDTAKAGVVTFQVTNTSKDTVHEMILVKLDKSGVPLPYDSQNSVLYEDKIGYLGEVEERDPGKSGTLTKVLKPGDYLLICNVAGHYAAGMWTPFTVTN